MKICRLSMWPKPTAVSPGSMSRWGIASQSNTRYARACAPALRWWLPGASSFSSCKANERDFAAQRLCAELGLDHEQDRGLLVTPALPDRADDRRADRGRHALAEPPAGGCLSGLIATDGGDHHPMAGTRRRRGRAADQRPGRARDERAAATHHRPLHLALRVVGRHPHVSERN